jgi:hypothetical protein
MRSIFSCCSPAHARPKPDLGEGGKANRTPHSALRERAVGHAAVTGQYAPETEGRWGVSWGTPGQANRGPTPSVDKRTLSNALR